MTSKDSVLLVRVDYTLPNLAVPQLILPSGEPVDGSRFVRNDALSPHVLDDIRRYPENYRTHQTEDGRNHRLVEIESYRMYRDYLICVAGSNPHRDVLLWKRVDSAYTLLSIHPCEVFGDFVNPVADTFAIGRVDEDMGDVGGVERYFTVASDTLRLIKAVYIQEPNHLTVEAIQYQASLPFVIRFIFLTSPEPSFATRSGMIAAIRRAMSSMHMRQAIHSTCTGKAIGDANTLVFVPTA